MADKQQTAVEWLEEQLIKEGIYVGEGFYEQAKQREKEQIIEFHVICVEDGYNIETDQVLTEDTKLDIKEHAEQFYNETYGKDSTE